MPAFPLVDTHVHLWDTEVTPIAWQQPGSVLARRFDVGDYREACDDVAVEAMVFVECFVDQGHFETETAFVTEQARIDPRIRAIVARASVEDGRRVLDFVGPLVQKYPLVKGIRRLIEFDPDPRICLKPGFIEGVQALGELGLSFDVNVHHSQLADAVTFARQADNVQLILDHCGKPGIRDGEIETWRRNIQSMAALPNTVCKLSDLPVEADHANWTPDQLRPYIDVVVDAFGFDRLLYGGDWPVCIQATTLPRWVGVLDRAFEGCSESELRKFYRDNAVRIYRLGL